MPELHQLTLWPQWAYCQIPRGGGVNFRKEEGGTIIILCASSGFKRGDRVSTPGRERQPSSIPPAIHYQNKVQMFRRQESLPYSLSKLQPQLTTTDRYIEVVHY